MRVRGLFSLREPGLLLSSAAHVALIVGGLVAVSSVTPLPPFEEGIAVEMITESAFSEITRGEEDAAEVAPVPAPRAERVAEAPELRPAGDAPRNTETPAARTPDIEVADRPVPAEAAPPPPPPPPPPAPAPVAEPAPLPPTPPTPTPAPPAPAPEPVLATPTPVPDAPAVAQAPPAEPAPPAPLPPSRSARAQAQAEAATRVAAERERERVAQAEARTREQQERERREREQAVRVASAAPTPAPAEAPRASRVAEESDRFDPSAIASILRSTEEAASTGAAAPEVNRTASLGTETGRADRLSPSMIAQLAGLVREQLHACWNVPLAAQTAQNPPTAAVRLALNVDGSFAASPQVVNGSADPLFGPVSESALRAAHNCAPLRIPAEFAPYYEEWRTMTVNFNPREA